VDNRVCLSHGVQVAGAIWWAAMKIVAGVGDLVQRTRNGRTDWILGGWTIKRSGNAVCDLHRACGDEELVEPQNQGRWFVSGLASRLVGRFSLIWPKNWWRLFLPIWPQNWWWVSWLSLKTKVVEGFSVWASKPATTV
jgi:hypothetical protein